MCPYRGVSFMLEVSSLSLKTESVSLEQPSMPMSFNTSGVVNKVH